MLKKNFVIILAFALPVIFVVLVAVGSYLPSWLVSTNYDFIYATCGDGKNYYSYDVRCSNYLQKLYTVQDGQLIINEVDSSWYLDNEGKPIPENERGNYTARLFWHDTEKNESQEITSTEAQTFQLNPLLTSPDKVTLSNNYDGGAEFFPFFDSNSSYGYYLTKGGHQSRLNLINFDDRYYYEDNFNFIGWILPGRN